MTQPLRTNIAKMRQAMVRITVLVDVMIYGRGFDERDAMSRLPVELRALRERIDALLARLEATHVP